MSNTNLPPYGRHLFPLRKSASANDFTLRDLYVLASISGNSMATELGRYLKIDETTFSSSPKDSSLSDQSSDAADIHHQALAAILEVVTANSNAPFEYVRAPEPQGGVQEWWARMISGSVNNTSSIPSCPSIGESL